MDLEFEAEIKARDISLENMRTIKIWIINWGVFSLSFFFFNEKGKGEKAEVRRDPVKDPDTLDINDLNIDPLEAWLKEKNKKDIYIPF